MYPITPATAQRTAELAANWVDRVNKVVGSKEAVEAVKAIMRHAAFEAAAADRATGGAIPKAAAAQAEQVGSVLGNIFSELVILFVRGLYIILEPLIDFMIAICKGSSDLLVALKSVFYVSLIFYVGLAIFNPTQFAAINAAVVAAYVALRTKVNGVVAKFQAFRKRNRTVNNLLNCGCRMCMTRWNDTHNTVDESQHKPKRARANECDCRKCMVAWNAAFNERDACTNPDFEIKFASPEDEARFMAKVRPVNRNNAAVFEQVNITDPADATKWAADMRAQIEIVENLTRVRTTTTPLMANMIHKDALGCPELEIRCASLFDMLTPYLRSADAIMHPESKRRVKALVRRTKNVSRRVRFAASDADKAALVTTIAPIEEEARTLGFYVRPSAAAPPTTTTAEPKTTTAVPQTKSAATECLETDTPQAEPKIVIMEADAPLLAAAAYADLPERRAALIGKLATYVSTARTNNNPAHQQYVDSALTMIKWIVTNAAKGNTSEAASHLASIEHTIAEADWLNEIKI